MNTSVLKLTDPIYPLEEAKSPNMTIRPPTPLTPNSQYSHSYSLFDNRFDVNYCNQCLNNNNNNNNPLTPLCKQHYLCSSCLMQNPVHYCPFCPMITPSRGLNASIPQYSCVKLSNIPWDVSQSDIYHFFSNVQIPSSSIYAQSIHILMDRTTGKTLSDAYVELVSHHDLKRAIETKNQKSLKGRTVTVTECQQDELLTMIFPKWRGKFVGISAIPPDTKTVKSMSSAAGGGGSTCPPFITREEINSLLVVCKNYKLHFSRKCAERPFENIISIITKYPWHQAHLITILHRDSIYEMLKLSIESLMNHLSKDYVQIDPTLLERLVRVGLLCPAFTEQQKMVLLKTSTIECPPDLYYLFYQQQEFNPIQSHYELPTDNVFHPSPLSSHHSSSYYDHHQHQNKFQLKRPSLPNHYPYTSNHHLHQQPSFYQHQQQRRTSSTSSSISSSSTNNSHYYDENDISQLPMVPPLSLPMKNQLTSSSSSSSLPKNTHHSFITSPTSMSPTLLSPWSRSYFPLDINSSHSSTWSMSSANSVVKSSNSIMSA
ncbi:hypothetical protein BJ944DRAFT_239845 [Cunninghamella echinulata]|nr:hypothetical protein BJ944DRAFT_239845 [Cunninghamella echinulata]